MAQTMNRKVQRAAARVQVPAKLNDDAVLKRCHVDAKRSTWLSDRLSGSRWETQSLDPPSGLG